MSLLLISIAPAVGSRIRLMHRSSVVLPDPLGPISATSSPAWTSRLTLSSAVTASSPLPNTLLTPCTLSTVMLASQRERWRRAQRLHDAEQARHQSANEDHRERDERLGRQQHQGTREVLVGEFDQHIGEHEGCDRDHQRLLQN